MTTKYILTKFSIIAAFAGFLFGFDTIVISGADKQLQDLWKDYTLMGSNDLFHGFIVVASALWGTVVGALLGGIPTDVLGRKKTLFLIGIFYSVSALGSALVSDPVYFSLFRFLGGLGVGVSTIAAPAYISEIAPAEKRGRLVALYQFNIVFGIVIAFLSNFLLKELGQNSWRWMIGVEVVPAVIYTFLSLGIPKSPRWLLVKKNNRQEAKNIIQLVNPQIDIDKEINSILLVEKNTGKKRNIFTRKYSFLLFLAFSIAFFNQFSGINAFLYYAPRIFLEAGLGKSTAFLSSIGIGLINLIFTLIGLSFIDKLGRKTLMYIGSFGYIISLSMVAAAFFYSWQGLFVPVFLFVFIASHAVGQGTVIWVFIAEIFPNHLRAFGQSVGSSTHWILAAIIPASIPHLFKIFTPWPVFAFFAFMMGVQLLWVIFLMPETKGKSLENIAI